MVKDLPLLAIEDSEELTPSYFWFAAEMIQLGYTLLQESLNFGYTLLQTILIFSYALSQN